MLARSAISVAKGARAASAAPVANGIIKVVAAQSSAPITSVSVHVAAGAAKTDVSNTGVPHLLTHLTLKETQNRTQFRLCRELQATGSQLRVSMDEDGITYMVNSLPEQLEKTMELIGDVVSNPAHFEWTIQDVAGAVKGSADSRKALEQAFCHTGLGAPMGLPVDFPVDSSTVSAFTKSHFLAGNVTVGAAGGSADKVADLVAKYIQLPAGKTEVINAPFNASQSLELSPNSIGEVAVVFGGEAVDRLTADVVRDVVEETLAGNVVDVLVSHTGENSALTVHSQGDATTMSSSAIIKAVKDLGDAKNISKDLVAEAVASNKEASYLVESAPEVLATALARGEHPAAERAALDKVTVESVAATIAQLTKHSSVTAVGPPSILF